MGRLDSEGVGSCEPCERHRKDSKKVQKRNRFVPFDQVKWTVSVSTCSSVCECFFFQRNHAFFLCPNYLRDFTRLPCAISTSLPPPYPSISQLALEKIKIRRPPSEEKKR